MGTPNMKFLASPVPDLRTSYHPALCFSLSVIFLLVDACVGLNWLLVSFLSHVNKNIIHSFIYSKTQEEEESEISYAKLKEKAHDRETWRH